MREISRLGIFLLPIAYSKTIGINPTISRFGNIIDWNPASSRDHDRFVDMKDGIAELDLRDRTNR